MRKILVRLVKALDKDVLWQTPLYYVTIKPAKLMMRMLIKQPSDIESDRDFESAWLLELGQL